MRIRSFADWGLKLGILFIGIWEFTPWFPVSLDLYDKLLTSIILLYFWFKFGTSDFIFGKKSRLFNSLILLGFYILSLDTFVKFAEQAGILTTIDGMPHLQFIGFDISAQVISLFSIYAGIAVLLLVAILAARTKFGEKSFIHSLWVLLFKRKWAEFSSKKNWRLVRFCVGFIILLVVSQYFFHLVTQWFVVSLDKSLLIVAVLFAIKDLEHSKVKALHTLGDIDDAILNLVRKLFTTPQTFFAGVGFLLMFHVLSDLSVFFVPYLLNLPFDSYYLGAIGSPGSHLTLSALFNTESVQNLSMYAAYMISGIGVLLLLIIPIALCILIVTNASVKKFFEYWWFRFIVIICLFFVLFFAATPWVKQKAIESPGVYGVDFVTQSLSSVSVVSISLLVLVFGLLLMLGLLFSKRISSYGVLALFFASFLYIGSYIWNFFKSSALYYLADINALFSLGVAHWSLLFLFGVLILLDLVFYLGGFVIFTYHSAKYLIRNFESELLKDSVALSMTFFIVLISMLFIFLQNLLFVGIALTVGCLFNLAFFFYLKGRKEYRDDFMLAVSLLIAAFVIVASLSSVLHSIGLSAAALNILGPFLIALLAFALVKFFKLSLSFARKYIKIKFVLLSAALAFLFSIAFHLVGEPVPELLYPNLLFVLLFTVVVAFSEELFFRFIILRLGEKGFGWRKAVIIQAVLFPLIHLLDIRFYLLSFTVWRLILYAVLLFFFSIVAALLVGKSSSKQKYAGNVVYAIILHLLTNFFMIVAA